MSEQPEKKFYLTTPIYYVNARPHIGHAYTTIVADVLARRHRLLGDNTFFLTGTDEHGQKIERSAAAAGVPSQQFTDEVSAEFRKLWDRMGLTYDDFIRTTDPKHKRGAQKLFGELYERGAIYLSSYTGQYCVSEEIFVEGPPGTIGPDGKPTETVTEENFFFRLSEYQRPLIDVIESDTLLISPETRKNEVLSFLRGNVNEAREKGLGIEASAAGVPYVPGALRDLSVSRSSFTWGIPVPEPAASATEKKHVMYVWLDALANYMTAVGYGSDEPEDAAEFARYWPADLHIMAKEITRQHCVYWPAFLMAAGLPLPKAVTAHGWLLFDNAKMSKSKGNIVRTETILEAFGEHVYGKQFPESTRRERDLFAADVLRYFLLREIPFGQDGSFSFEAMVTRYNADLANGYGNLVSRTLAMIHRYFGGSLPVDSWLSHESFPIGQSLLSESIDLTKVASELTSYVTQIDGKLSAKAPWKLAKSTDVNALGDLKAVLYQSAESIRIITALFHPILPFSTARVWQQLGLGDVEEAARNGELANLQWGGLKPDTKFGALAPIFPRADKGLAQIMIDMENERSASQTAMQEEDGKRPAAPLKSATTPAPSAPAVNDPSSPAAGPRTGSLDEPAGTLSVGGSAATSTHSGPTPSHTEAVPSGPFASAAAQTPITAEAADASPQITIDDFAKVELRVAQVVLAERIPKADKLLRLEVDLGYERRQILSGIAEWYAPEDLVGRRIVVITNLAPRKMRGLDSHGMLLAASEGAGGKPVLATMAEEIALGSRLK